MSDAGRPPETDAPDLDAAWQPLALALRDVHEGKLDAVLRVESDLWCAEEMPATDYYRTDQMPLDELDVEALDLCRGRVLDIGAGAGRHALELQGRGLEVVALDVSSTAVEIMRQRGVRQTLCADLFTLRTPIGRFDTLLLLMHGLGFVGTLPGLGRFLDLARTLMAPGAQILCDSADLWRCAEDGELEDIEAAAEHRSYLGEVEFRLEYAGIRGAPYHWLFVDPATLSSIAEAHGYRCSIVATADRGAYLACLEDRRA